MPTFKALISLNPINPGNCKIYVIIYVNKTTSSLPAPSKTPETAQPDGSRKHKAGTGDRSVRRDKTVGEQSATHLVRHLVSAQSVIIAAEAGVYNNIEGWEEKQNSSSFQSDRTYIVSRYYDDWI